MNDWRDVDRHELEKHLNYELEERGLTRRDLVRGGMSLAAALGLGSLFAACGGDGEEQGVPEEGAPPPAAETQATVTEEDSTAAPADQPSNVAEAQRLATQAMEVQEFTEPTEPFDMSVNRGKTAWGIWVTLAIPLVAESAAGFSEAGEAAGVTVTNFDGKGSVAEYNKGIQNAIAANADAIMFQSIDPKFVSGSINQAAGAGIKIVDSQNREPGSPTPPPIYGDTGFSFKAAGSRIADYIIWQSNGEARVLWFRDPVIIPLQLNWQYASEEFARLGPECEVTLVDFDLNTLATTFPTRVATILRREPQTTWVVGAFDASVKFIEAGMRQAGVMESVRVAGIDAVTENLEEIREGGPQEVDAGISSAWQGWAEMDMVGRALADAPPVASSVPVRLFTRENLPATGTDFFQTDFRTEFKRLWGIA